MIDLHNYLLFITASIVLCVVPGPDMIYLLSRTIAQGKRAGLMAAIGINLGAYFHLFATILGLSAILATSTFVFTLVKLAGAAYLIYLGMQAFFNRGAAFKVSGEDMTNRSIRAILWQGFLSDALNPKVAIFFLALLPQFLDVGGSNEVLQLLILGFTVNIIAILINIGLVLFAATITSKLRQSDAITGWLNKAMGTIFIFLGFRLANEKF